MPKGFLSGLFGGQKKDEPADERTLAVAVAALMVEAARADEAYTDAERALIDRLLTDGFGVAPAACAAVRAEAEGKAAAAADLYQFTRRAKELPAAGKSALMEALWRIVLSDGSRGAWEETLIRRVAGLLHIEDQESARARQRVLAAPD